jgi:hypothetical protein
MHEQKSSNLVEECSLTAAGGQYIVREGRRKGRPGGLLARGQLMIVVEWLHGVQPLPQHPRLLLACQLLCTANKNNFILQTYGNVNTISKGV